MRKAILFTFDALLASMLLVAALILILYAPRHPPSISQSSYYAQDALTALSAIEIGELDSSWVRTLIANGTIDDEEMTVLEQIGNFWATNRTEYAENLTRIVLEDILPPGYGLSLSMGGDELYLRDSPYPAVGQRMVGRRMITGIQKGATLEGSTSTAYLKRIQGKETNAFAYFGGFVGQGDIMTRLDGLPSDINASNVEELFLEGEFDSDFKLSIEGSQCGGTYSSVKTDLVVQRFNITSCADLLNPGNNTVLIENVEDLTNASISGGLLGVRYTTTDFQEPTGYGEKRSFLPDIDGVINLYDAFRVPGTLLNMSLYLHYWVVGNSTLPIYFDIGNTTIFTFNATGENTYTFTDGYLDGLLNYSLLSNTTTPFRFGFYEGNNTNSSGNISDAFLITSKHHSMSTEDIVVNASANRSRIEQVKLVDELFVNILLNASGNRVGLISFGTGASIDLDSTLSADNVTLQSIISTYAPHPTDAQRYLCGAMETAKAQLISVGGVRKRAIMLMTDGDLKKASGKTKTCAFGQTSDRALIWADAVKQACDFSDPVHGNPENITFYTVAFGPEAVNDPAIIANLSKMANCTGGMFASGMNASDLEEIYQLFAADLAASSIVFDFQRAVATDNVGSRLYGDSHFNLTFEPTTEEFHRNQIPITFQTPQFGTCTPTVTIPAGLSVIDAHVVSYSGDYWSRQLDVDGTNVYNLSLYGFNYTNLGDPYQILIPPNMLASGSHSLDMSIGANASVDEGCSLNNSMIYTGLINTSTSRTTVLPNTIGCYWEIEFEDGSFLNVSVPSTYGGAKNCTYTNASISYDDQDAYDAATYSLLYQLDFDKDGRVFVNLEEADLEIIVTLVSQVPYLWGPSLATLEVWR